jgi:hypothetical protein
LLSIRFSFAALTGFGGAADLSASVSATESKLVHFPDHFVFVAQLRSFGL